MFEKVTVTDAMAEDIEKLSPRLKKVHIRELVLAMAIMPKTHKPIFTVEHAPEAAPHRALL